MARLGGSETPFTSCSQDTVNTMWPHTVLLSPTQIPGLSEGHTLILICSPLPGWGMRSTASGLLPHNNPSRLHPYATLPFPAWVFPQLCRPVFCLISSIMSVHPVRPSASRGSWPSSRPLSLQFGAYLVKS